MTSGAKALTQEEGGNYGFPIIPFGIDPAKCGRKQQRSEQQFLDISANVHSSPNLLKTRAND